MNFVRKQMLTECEPENISHFSRSFRRKIPLSYENSQKELLHGRLCRLITGRTGAFAASKGAARIAHARGHEIVQNLHEFDSSSKFNRQRNFGKRNSV